MKTLEIDLNKLSREGLKCYLKLLDELEQGVDLPLPHEYPIPPEPEESKPEDEKTPSFNV